MKKIIVIIAALVTMLIGLPASATPVASGVVQANACAPTMHAAHVLSVQGHWSHGMTKTLGTADSALVSAILESPGDYRALATQSCATQGLKFMACLSLDLSPAICDTPLSVWQVTGITAPTDIGVNRCYTGSTVPLLSPTKTFCLYPSGI